MSDQAGHIHDAARLTDEFSGPPVNKGIKTVPSADDHSVIGFPRQRRRLVPFKDGLAYGGFGRTKAYELIAEGKIMAVKMGSRTLIDLDTVDAYHKSLPMIEPHQ